MEEILEIAVGSLHLMAKDITVRAQLRQLNSIPTFVQVSAVTSNISHISCKAICFTSVETALMKYGYTL